MPSFKLIFQTKMFSASVVVLIVTRMVTILFVQEGFINSNKPVQGQNLS